ncbi:hypothetical protein SAMN05442782_9562 [Streptomyces sp. OK228]|nr:hypothetical protein SAMN05442782_9562 [Streptomyces sp. OK228]
MAACTQGFDFCGKDGVLEMTSQAEATSLRIAKALSYVCGHQDELAALLDEEAVSLHNLAAVVSLGAPGDASLTTLLDTLHTAIQRAGDPTGVYGGPGRNLTPAGVSDLEIVFRCPLRLCIGRSAHEVGGDAPRCRFDPAEAVLIRERLP